MTLWDWLGQVRLEAEQKDGKEEKNIIRLYQVAVWPSWKLKKGLQKTQRGTEFASIKVECGPSRFIWSL